DINFFRENPEVSWKMIKEVFFSEVNQPKPNKAHLILAEMEEAGILKSIITQNIDNLHQEAGSRNVLEFHGNCRRLVCLGCDSTIPLEKNRMEKIPVRCDSCGGLVRPDFIFFSEPIHPGMKRKSFLEAEKADTVLVIGTTGEVYPSAMVPAWAKTNGAFIIEINVKESEITRKLADIFIEGKATEIMEKIGKGLPL
ncbi:MAG: SIR2 family NAD-dependent protein deacylase, partial [Vulcanimicrobiota bacterium]